MPGEYVLVQTPEPSGSVGVDKLAPRWQGPFRVLSRDGESAYTVFDTTRAKQYQVRATHPSQMTNSTGLTCETWTTLKTPAVTTPPPLR